MKKVIRNIWVLVMVLVCLTMTACSTREGESIEGIVETVATEREGYLSYDKELINLGEEELCFFEAVPGRTYSVSFKNTRYTANINGDVQYIELVEPTELEPLAEDTGRDVTNRTLMSMANRAKGIVVDYIRKSTILRDKEYLIEKIMEAPVRYGKDSSESCMAFYRDETIFVNKNANQNDVCEWLFVHELVHYLCELTHGGAGNEDYPFSLFVETMTDLITMSMDPWIWDNIMSAYSDYYQWVLPYVGQFGEDAIKAYFYGHEEIWKKVGKDKFDLYVFSIEHAYDVMNVFDVPVPWVLINNTINEWACSK